ncbi:putative manganese transporter [Sediminimonas sp.]|uniref:putative manganese transporter n=1 Tax=Sediminimonas sp. TaxID=2823379 RepID=UPI0025DDE1CD|nr:putative manganese transporter [Sediminimonas sp.]
MPPSDIALPGTPAAPATAPVATSSRPPRRPRRMLVAAALLLAALAPGELGAVTRELMVDAYLGVSVFVAATLLLFYGAERVFRFDIGDTLRAARWSQVPIAALMGATPGCGGAVVVVAAYSAGNVRFGAVVAALTATMGDAAFLLLATRPDAAAVVLPLSLVVGVVSGWLIDRMIGDGLPGARGGACDAAPRIGRRRPRDYLFLLIAAPGVIVGGADLLTVDIAALTSPVVPLALGLGGTAMGLWVWAGSSLHAMTNPADAPVTRMAEETSFISVWVIGAFMAYEYAVAFAGLDLGALFATIMPLIPLIGILVGFIPGCGPQILVTTLYINGLVPFSVLMGNAISNDGDALFPAIALNPRAAVLATLYSAIPALIVAYGFYFLAPGFMS